MNAQVKPTETEAPIQLPSVRKPQEFRVVSDPIPVLDTGRFEHMQRIATVMAASNLIPDSLCMTGDKDNKVLLPTAQIVANCFLVVNQAVRWGLDPFAVAQCVSVVHGKLCYEGKLIAAVIEAKLGIRLKFKWDDKQGDALGITVSGQFPDEDEARIVKGTVGEWKTTGTGTPWTPKQSPKMLAYRGSREWGRLHSPSLMLGVYSEDELGALSDDRRARRAQEVISPRDDGPPAPSMLEHKAQVAVPETATARQTDVELVKSGRDNGQQVEWGEHSETTIAQAEPAAFDEAEWLRNLAGALGGCEDYATAGEQQRDLMMPWKKLASPAGWKKAEKLVADALNRINTILAAG